MTEMSVSEPGLLRAVDAVDWAAYAIPPVPRGYRPERPPVAFRRLLALSTFAEASAVQGEMLFAVGNDHAGCLYPAAVPAAPLLARIVRERSGWARWLAMETLIEFLSFDVNLEEFTDPAGRLVRTKDAILEAVLEIHDDLERLGATRPAGRRPTSSWSLNGRPPTDAPIGYSASDLLDVLDDNTAGR